MDSQEYASPVFSPFGGMGAPGKAIPSFQVSAFPAFYVANPSPSGAHVRRIRVGVEACPLGFWPQRTQRAQRRARERPGSSEAARTLQRHCEEKLHGVEPKRRRKNRGPERSIGRPGRTRTAFPRASSPLGEVTNAATSCFSPKPSGSAPLILEGRVLNGIRAYGSFLDPLRQGAPTSRNPRSVTFQQHEDSLHEDSSPPVPENLGGGGRRISNRSAPCDRGERSDAA